MAYSLMFSLPGTPTLFYGEEIGMAENLDVEDRLAVRTPMQWTGDAPAGFSSAPADGSSDRCPRTSGSPHRRSTSAASAPIRTRCSTGSSA